MAGRWAMGGLANVDAVVTYLRYGEIALTWQQGPLLPAAFATVFSPDA